MKLNPILLTITSLLLTAGCASSRVSIHPNWEGIAPNKIAVLGFLPYSPMLNLAGFESYQKDTLLKSWWLENLDENLIRQLRERFKDYDFMAPTEVIAHLRNQGMEDVLDSLRANVYRSLEFSSSVYYIRVDRLPREKVSSICRTLNVDALLIGLNFIRPFELSSGGSLLHSSQILFDSGVNASLISLSNEELWKFGQYIATGIHSSVRAGSSLFYDARYKRYLLDNITNLRLEAFSGLISVFPTRKLYQPKKLSNVFIPLVISDEDELTVVRSESASMIIRDSSGNSIYTLPRERKSSWDYKVSNTRVAAGMYTITSESGQTYTVTVPVASTKN